MEGKETGDGGLRERKGKREEKEDGSEGDIR